MFDPAISIQCLRFTRQQQDAISLHVRQVDVAIDAYPAACLQALTGMFAKHSGHIDDRWARFMKYQISRARAYFADAQARPCSFGLLAHMHSLYLDTCKVLWQHISTVIIALQHM